MAIKKLSREDFPLGLLEIPEPPKELYIDGALPPEDTIYLCIVGSRKHTPYGRQVCEEIIEGLKGYPITIVSGLAIGMDSIAHKKALDVGLRTVAFPGSGLSDEAIYPRTNLWLAKQIVKNGGCLLSEYEPNFRGALWSFAKRNRLMAGISQAILIIEAEEKSGTLITARLGVDYNRDIYTVPGSIFSSNSKGTNRLLRQGATPITSAEDVLDALGFQVEKVKKDITAEEEKLISYLKKPTSRETLMQKMKMKESELNVILYTLEIKEVIKEEFGKIRIV